MATERPHRIRHARNAFAERVRRGDTYSLLLAVLIAGYIVIALLERSLWARFTFSIVMGLVFLLALYTSRVRGRAFRVGCAAVAVIVLATLIQALAGREGNDGSTYVIFILVLIAPVVVLNRILRHDVIGTETILGAVCVYVLLGIAFAGIYAGMDDFDQGTFFAQRVDPAVNVEFLYFSFITLTTVGFGDLTPGTDSARVVVTFEALLGQVFLVTLVARLVAMYGVRRVPTAGGADELSARRDQQLE